MAGTDAVTQGRLLLYWAEESGSFTPNHAKGLEVKGQADEVMKILPEI
jgi:hypothetical protein